MPSPLGYADFLGESCVADVCVIQAGEQCLAALLDPGAVDAAPRIVPEPVEGLTELVHAGIAPALYVHDFARVEGDVVAEVDAQVLESHEIQVAVDFRVGEQRTDFFSFSSLLVAG